MVQMTTVTLWFDFYYHKILLCLVIEQELKVHSEQMKATE